MEGVDRANILNQPSCLYHRLSGQPFPVRGKSLVVICGLYVQNLFHFVYIFISRYMRIDAFAPFFVTLLHMSWLLSPLIVGETQFRMTCKFNQDLSGLNLASLWNSICLRQDTHNLQYISEIKSRRSKLIIKSWIFWIIKLFVLRSWNS